MKEIEIATDYIKLGQFLKLIGAVSMGGETRNFLIETEVKINQKIEKQRGKKLFSGDLIEIQGEKYLLKHSK